MAIGNYLTSAEAGKMLGVSDIRVRQFYGEGRLPGRKVGQLIFFERKDVEKFKQIKRETGRPAAAQK